MCTIALGSVLISASTFRPSPLSSLGQRQVGCPPVPFSTATFSWFLRCREPLGTLTGESWHNPLLKPMSSRTWPQSKLVFHVCVSHLGSTSLALNNPHRTHDVCHQCTSFFSIAPSKTFFRIFAVLLFMYELVRVMGSCERPKQVMTKNFGFFFGAKGRGLYLIL